MRPIAILNDFLANLRMWYRSKGTVFWAIAFPILLMLIFGAIYQGQGDITVSLYVQDLDGSEISEEFISSLSEQLNIEDIPADVDGDEYISENNIRAALIIPEDFGNTIYRVRQGSNESILLSLSLDPTRESVNGIIRGVVGGTIHGWNNEITGSRDVLTYQVKSLTAEEFKFIDYFMPGVIGLTVMTSTIYGTIFRNTKYRKWGILRKLSTTPFTRWEYLISKMLFMTFVSFVSTFLIILVGVVVWNISVTIDAYLFVIVVSAAFAFSGMGMIISRFVKEEETADSAAGAITFPQMFLAGTFFPLEVMPSYLSSFARVLPLYYVNEGLRDAMIYQDSSGALFNTAVIFSIAAVLFVIGALATKWTE
ncbi:MAG: ABC transporter permease [Candidatus Saliniplasma sp.]